MAIRRITELPVLSGVDSVKAALGHSLLEVSYGEVDSEERPTGKYVSRCVPCMDLISAVPIPDVFYTRKTFLSGIGVSSDFSLSGNLFINDEINDYSQFSADMRFGKFDLMCGNTGSVGISAGESINLICGSGSVKVENGSSNTGVVKLSESATVDKTIGSDTQSVVNTSYLSAELTKWKNKIIEELKATAEIKYSVNMPLLSFVFVDHTVNNDEWKRAGSTVDLTEYTVLKTFIDENPNSLRKGTASEEDTWYYKLEGNKLTLPYTKWFFQGNGGVNDEIGVKYNKQAFPSHQHTYSSMVKNGGLSMTGFGVGLNKVGNGSQYTGTAGTGTVVQPHSTTMYVYFYVGPKNAS